MKKILLIPLLLLSILSFSQVIVNRAGPANTVSDKRLQAEKNLLLPRYDDTTTANIAGANLTTNNIGIDSCGAKIYTRNPQAVWTRYCNPKRWVRDGSDGSSSAVTVQIINDSTMVICSGNGTCDTIQFTSSITNINNFEFITDSSVRICHIDTISGGTVSVCDTIIVTPPLIADFYQNWLHRVGTSHIVEFGSSGSTYLDAGNILGHDTYASSFNNRMFWQQRIPYEYGHEWQRDGVWQTGTGLVSWWHMDDLNNSARLGVNYVSHPYSTVPSFINGYFHPYKGYTIGTNGTGAGSYGWRQDDAAAKTVGIFLHAKDTANNYGVSIYARPPTAGVYLNDMNDYVAAHFRTSGDIQFPFYPSTRNDGTAPMAFYPDGSGNVKVGPVAGGSTITIINDTTITICSFGENLCDTFFTTVVNHITDVRIINDSTIVVCDSVAVCDTLIVSPTGFDRGYFDPNQTSTGHTYHHTNLFNFSVGEGLVTSPTASESFNFGLDNTITGGASRNYVFIHGNTVSGSENFVPGRNMVVAGNTNFVAATDGQVFSTANYSATFGDATINRGITGLTAGFGNENFAESGFTMGSNNVNGGTGTGVGTANQYSNSTVLGLQNISVGSRNIVGGAFLFANNTSGDVILFGKGTGTGAGLMSATTTSSFNVGFGKTTPDFVITSSKVRINDSRFEEYGVSASVTAAGDLTLTSGNRFTISGATTINAITTANWQDGSKVWFIFSGAPLVKNNTAGGAGTATILLAGRIDFQAAAGDVLYLGYNGTNWYEINRALASGGGSFITADNGLTANTATNVQLGSSSAPGSALLHNSFIDAGTFYLKMNSTAFPLWLNSSGTYGEYITATGGGTIGLAIESNNLSISASSAESTSGVFASNYASTNTVQPVIQIWRNSTSASANGVGGSIDYYLSDDAAPSVYLSNQLISKWTNVTHASRTSQLDITGVGGATTRTIMSAYGSGVVGIGISSGYIASRLQVVNDTASGPIVRVTTTSTAASGNAQNGIEVIMSGANASGGQLTRGIASSNNHTGGGTNFGGSFGASGGSVNVAVSGSIDGTGNSAAIYGTNSAAGKVAWFQANSSGNALLAEAASGVAIIGTSNSGPALQLLTNGTSNTIQADNGGGGLIMSSLATFASTNTVETMFEFARNSSGTGASGIGGSIDLLAEYDAGSAVANRVKWQWSDATTATRTSALTFTGVNSASTVDLLILSGNGTVKLRPITATAASAITPAEGMLVFVSSTDATFISVGIWCYQNGAWKAL